MKTELKVLTSEFIHHFFFLYNVGGQFHWNRKDYNEAWLKITGPFSSVQKNLIKGFGEMIIKYREKKVGLFDFACRFSSEKDFFEYIKKFVSVRDLEKIKRIFKETLPLFNKIWCEVKKDASLVQPRLQKIVGKNQKQIHEIFDKLSILYDKKLDAKLVFRCLFVLIPIDINSGGGLFSPPNICLIHGSAKRLKNRRSLETIIHELIHAYFERPKFKELVDQNNRSQFSYYELKEVFATALLPNGCFSRKYFRKKIQNIKHSAYKYQAGFNLISLVNDYVEKNKKFDRKLIEEGIKILAETKGAAGKIRRRPS